MIKIFGVTDRVFNTNGDKILNPTKAKVHKEDNGNYYIDIEAGLEYLDYLNQGNIIIAPTPTGEQAFRLDSPEKKKFKINVRGWHVFYDSENYLIEDSYVVDKNCNDALDHLNNACETQTPFTTLSDVSTTKSFRCVRKSFYEAINTVLERWGGHLVRNNFRIEIRDSIGQDNGVIVRYRKNLEDITCTENWSNVVTKLLPVGKDGLMLEEKYIVSDIQYEIPYTKTVSFSQDIDEEDFKDGNGNLDESNYNQALINDLRNQAKAYIETNKYPQINYTLKADIHKITDIGDTVQVIDERLGISLITRVVSFEFDAISEKFTSVEFGNFKESISGLANSITSSTTEIIEQKSDETMAKMLENLTIAGEKIWGAMGNSYVIYNGSQIMVVDKLPKDVAKNVILINNGGIAFSQNGINGNFNSAWTIDGTFNCQVANMINLSLSMIKGETLKLGSNLNESGIVEIYDEANVLIGLIDKNGIRVNGKDGSYVLINHSVGFAGYDKNNNKIYWMDKDEFHMKKSVVEEEITLCNKVRFIPITITEGNVVTVDGIGLVSTIN